MRLNLVFGKSQGEDILFETSTMCAYYLGDCRKWDRASRLRENQSI